MRQPFTQQTTAPTPTPLFPPAAHSATPAAEPMVPATTVGGLPKRRRQSPVSVVPSAAPEPVPGNDMTASRLGAFQRGTRSGRGMTTMEGPESQ